MTDDMRLRDLERAQAVLEARQTSMDSEIGELRDAIKSLRAAILTFAFTVAGSAIAVLLALIQTSG